MNGGIGVGEQMCPGRMGVDEPRGIVLGEERICQEARLGHERTLSVRTWREQAVLGGSA